LKLLARGNRRGLVALLSSAILVVAGGFVAAGLAGWPTQAGLPPGGPIVTNAAPSIAVEPTSASVTLSIAQPTPATTPDPTPEPLKTVDVASVVAPPPAAATPSGYRIQIARLGINLPIAEGDVPRDVDRAQTPEHYAFHLPGTSMFGAGNTYIYAHARVGMFLSLWNARVGDVVTVRTPNGIREYVVEEVHPRVPPLEISWAGPTADTRLTLQTSTGPNGTDPRFVVVARPR
jgi:sortase (surface protein transpeptidase)